jgi:hypothetical protein
MNKENLVQIHNGITIKKNEIISFVRKWMELEISMVSKISLSNKDKSNMFSLICMT